MSRQRYLITYDIADHKRLGRVARYMGQHACRVQFSVFAAVMDRSCLHHFLADLKTMIDPKHDDVRAYPVSPTGDVTLLGEQFLAVNTLLGENGQSRLVLVQDPPDREYLSDKADD